MHHATGLDARSQRCSSILVAETVDSLIQSRIFDRKISCQYVTCQNVTEKSCMMCRPLWFVEDFNVVTRAITHGSENI